jgi:alkylation response protein AidB-like acyl-CoA dehydrogenase
VKHKLAKVHTASEDARPAAWYAAYALAHDLPDAARAASVAKVAASRAEALANAEALQCHGGIGFTWEHDLHIWLKRGLALQPAFGTPAEHRAMLARMEDADA